MPVSGGSSPKAKQPPAQNAVIMRLEEVTGIPILHAAPADGSDRPLPTVFFLHSFRVSKELISYFGYMLGLAGFRVLLPDAPAHGERFDGDDTRRLRSFWTLLRQSIDELPQIRDFYAERGLIDDIGRVGVAGTSFGAFAALSAAGRYSWVCAAACLMGTGYFIEASRTIYPPGDAFSSDTRGEYAKHIAPLKDYEIAAQIDRLAQLPLYVWHGQKDEVVPFADAIRLQAAVLAAGGGARLDFVSDPLGSHKVTMDAAAGTVSFFVKWMGRTDHF